MRGDEGRVSPDGPDPFVVEYHGKTAHAAGDPWNRRSAADAIELYAHGLNMLREHVKPSVRIHYTVEKAGDVPNVVPDYARILTWMRDSKRAGVDEVFARVQDIARGAALPLKPIPPDAPGGSSDVGDVSWVVPTLHFYVATAPKDVPWHAWPVVAASGMSIGHKGMMLAASTLAATAVDLFENAAAREAIRAEFAEKTKGVTYRWSVPDGPPPVPTR